MNLLDVIQKLDLFDNDLTIYADKNPEWTESSTAIVELSHDEAPPSRAGKDLDYFLEVELAKDAIRVWSEWRNGRTPDLTDKFKAVLYYAVYDAFLPTELD